MMIVHKKFKEQHSVEERKIESEKILKFYSDRVPIIIEKDKSSKLPDLDINKFFSLSSKFGLDISL